MGKSCVINLHKIEQHRNYLVYQCKIIKLCWGSAIAKKTVHLPNRPDATRHHSRYIYLNRTIVLFVVTVTLTGINISTIRPAGACNQLSVRADRSEAAPLSAQSRSGLDGKPRTRDRSPLSARARYLDGLGHQQHIHDRQETDREDAR